MEAERVLTLAMLKWESGSFEALQMIILRRSCVVNHVWPLKGKTLTL